MIRKNIRKKYDFCFVRWTRTPYAVFNSLHKVVKIGVVTTSCGFLSLHYQPLFSQTPVVSDTASEREIELAEVVISDTRTAVFAAAQQITSVISRSDIEQSGVETLQDLLLYVQGVDLRTRGGNGVQADVSLRGGTFDQMLILVNGINLTDPQTGHHSLNIPVPVEAIERIEIIEGPGLLAHHATAFSGCINIITRLSDENGLELSVLGGMYGFFRAGANTNVRIGRWRLSAGGDVNRSRGFTDNTDYTHGNGFVRLRYESARKGTFDMQAGYQEKQFGANSFYSPAYKDQFEHIRTFFVSGNYTLVLRRWKVAAGGYTRKHFDRFALFRNEISAPSFYTRPNYHQTTVSGVNVQASYAYSWGSTALGADYREAFLLSNNLGNPLEKTVRVPFEHSAAFYDKSALVRQVGWQLQQNYHRKNVKTSLSARAEWTNRFGINWSLAVNGIVFFRHRIEVDYFVQNTYRLPTFTDLYYSSPTQKGNPDLSAEQAITVQAGIAWKPDRWQVQVRGFYRYGFALIDWVRLPEDAVWFCRNILHVQAGGADVSASYRPKKGYLTHIGVQYNYMNVKKGNEDGYHWLYTAEYLRHQVKLHIDHRIAWKLYAGWQFNLQDRAGTYRDAGTNRETKYKPYLLCYLKISLRLTRIRFFIEANNLFDSPYMDLGNLPQAGIWIKGGVSARIW
jgi:iron complex outermembrane receptor protein